MKVVLDFAAQRISIEGDEPKLVELLQAVRQLAPSLTQINIVTTSVKPPSSAEKPAKPASNCAPEDTGQTLKQFVRPLTLNNAAERVAAVAYYMRSHEGRETFSPKDMEGWFTIAGLQKPATMPVAIFDAKKKYGYLESPGHAKWRLTVQGENLIAGKLNGLSNQDE